MARQCALKFERACMPFQFALSTRAGTVCVACVVRSLMELDSIAGRRCSPSAGLGPSTNIKRKAMMEALHTIPESASLLPFVRLFHPETCGMKTMVCRTSQTLWVSTQLSHKSMPPCARAR